MSLKRSAAAALLSWMVVVVVTAQSVPDSAQTLFTINKKPVTTAEFVYLYRKNHQHKPEEFTKEKIEAYLDLFINYKLKVEEALSRGMDTTAAFRQEYQTYRDELLKPYLPDSKVVDSLVALTYERLKEEISASHILIALEADATPADTLKAYNRISELRMRAVAGADFNELAARFSEEPGAAMTKGNLGYFTALQMVFPFEQAAYSTPVGSVSDPVRTAFGYHILKVWDRQPSRGEVEVSHIMIRTDGADNEEDKNAIFDIHDKLQKGKDWDELCRQYSEDANSKDQGGKLRPFGVGGMSSVPEFRDMAFSLQEEGEISDPVKTQYGWHILRLESRIPLPPFPELKASLTQRVSRDERVTISKAALRAKMRAEFGYAENAIVKDKILDMGVRVFQERESAGKDLENEVLFYMQSRPFHVKGFLDYAAARPPKSGPETAKQHLRQLLEQYTDSVYLDLMVARVKRESPDYKWLLKEYYEGILLFEIMEREVWNKAMEDTAGQQRYYASHAPEYQAGERMAGKIFSGSSKGQLEELKRLLESKDPTAAEFLKKNRIREDSGSFQKEDRPVLQKTEWQPGFYLVENAGVYYLVAIDKILPPGPETFEEARASVISDYQTFLEDSWIRELKRKFGVNVDKKAKKRAFRLLTITSG